MAEETSRGDELGGRILRWDRGRQVIVRLDDGRDLRAILTLKALEESGQLEGSIEGARVRVKLCSHPKMHRIIWLRRDNTSETCDPC